MSREVLGSRSSSADELVEDDTGPPPRPGRAGRALPWWPSRRAGLLALAFLLGGVGGALAWDNYRDRQDAASAMATVDLTARLRQVVLPADESTFVRAYIVVENDGPEPIRVEAIEMAGPGYIPRFDLRDGPFAVEAQDATTQGIAFDVVCSDPPNAVVEVGLRVLTADDVSRTVMLPLVDERRHLRQTRLEVCDRDDVRVSVLAGGTGQVVAGPTPVLQLPVVVESYRSRSTVVTSVAAATPQLEVTADGLPVEINGGGSPRFTLTWRVVDCTAATALDFWELGLVVSAHRAGGPTIEATVTVDPDLALDVAAFVADTCRAET